MCQLVYECHRLTDVLKKQTLGICTYISCLFQCIEVKHFMHLNLVSTGKIATSDQLPGSFRYIPLTKQKNAPLEPLQQIIPTYNTTS